MEDVIEMENTPTVPNNELEQRYIRYKDVIKELTIMNDIFMRNVFKKRECIEHVLRIIMEMKNLQVLDYTVQKDYKNLQGRSAILDCVARDDVNNQYNVEIQQDTEGASPKRARYHSGLLETICRISVFLWILQIIMISAFLRLSVEKGKAR